MGRLRRHRTIPALLGAFALLSSVLAGALGYGPVKRAAPIVDDVLGVLTLCAPDAIQDGGHGGLPVHGPADHCPACVSFAKLAVVAAAVLLAIILFPLPTAPRPLPARVRAPRPRLSLGGIGSRAPPLFA